MKRITALIACGLMASFAVSGCATSEYVYITPQCTPPPEPLLTSIDKGGFWDVAGDGLYRDVETYINSLWAYADEQRAMLDELCGK